MTIAVPCEDGRAAPHGIDPAELRPAEGRGEGPRPGTAAQGKWVHLWRIAGQYSNFIVFDVESHDELHDILSTLPLFPFMDIQVTPLAHHPSAVG